MTQFPLPGKLHFSLMLVAGVFILAGCTSAPVKSEKPAVAVIDDSTLCQQLQDVFRESTNGFQSIREQPNYHNKATLWKSRFQLIDNSCEIWQWSDKYSYVCNRAMPDQQSAETVYRNVSDRISACLDQASALWQEREVSLDNQGQEVQYSIDTTHRGSLKVVNTGGVFRDSWTVYFRVDSPGMLRINPEPPE